VQGDSVLILRQLLEALKAKATPAFRNAAAKRMEAMNAKARSGALLFRSKPRTRG